VLQPDNPASWLQLGLFDLEHHHPRQAVQSLERSLTLNPTAVATAQGLAQARAELAAARG
jgi:cytochrome c-type biogenesis protein CcmH/NrfG